MVHFFQASNMQMQVYEGVPFIWWFGDGGNCETGARFLWGFLVDDHNLTQPIWLENGSGLKMHFLLKMGIFRCDVSLPVGTWRMGPHLVSSDRITPIYKP